MAFTRSGVRSEQLAKRVRRLLSRQGVVEKRMMGGICFMLNGHMCCGISASAFMVRVGPAAYPRMLAQPHVRPLEFAGRRPRGFVLVDPRGCTPHAALSAWVRRGITFVSTLPPRQVGPFGRRPSDAVTMSSR
jgi:TfoX/Sxy family transcriptional regulator of competence genes